MEVSVLWDVTTLSARCLLTFKAEQFPTTKREAVHLPVSEFLQDSITFYEILNFIVVIKTSNIKQTNKLRGFSPQANYTDRATAACRRS
jgi:hypothetical protein